MTSSVVASSAILGKITSTLSACAPATRSVTASVTTVSLVGGAGGRLDTDARGDAGEDDSADPPAAQLQVELRAVERVPGPLRDLQVGVADLQLGRSSAQSGPEGTTGPLAAVRVRKMSRPSGEKVTRTATTRRSWLRKARARRAARSTTSSARCTVSTAVTPRCRSMRTREVPGSSVVGTGPSGLDGDLHLSTVRKASGAR
ncbi:MAG: hypothetical protein JWO62_1372 [Acidimicrobiaceae bacterium]|nr:hypothetical protein [Acidimicrobiaceae bacterium]